MSNISLHQNHRPFTTSSRGKDLPCQINLNCFNQKTLELPLTGLFDDCTKYKGMLLWAQILTGAFLALTRVRAVELTEVENPETEVSSSVEPDIVNRDSKCFNVKPEACNLISPYGCKCKSVDEQSVFCCGVSSKKQLTNDLGCSGVNKNALRNLHITNSTISELNFLSLSQNLESFSVTESKLEKFINLFYSNLSCLNLSTNAVFDIDVDLDQRLARLEVADFSRNNITKLPKKFIQENVTLDISYNTGVECQTLMQFLTDNPTVIFNNIDATYCSSSKNFHWFNSIAQVPLSQVLILRNIEQNCTKGCNCRSHRLDMVPGKPPTVSVLVDCSFIGLKELPEYLPTNTISLNVSYNNITSLDRLTFDENYEDIREFYADSNQISSILSLEGSKFIDNFAVLSLRENNIKSLPTYILSNTFDRNYHSRQVNLGGNRLICNCSVAQVVKVWLLSNKKHIPDYDQILCDNTGEKVMALDQNKVCVYQRDWTDYIYYIIAGEIALLVLLIGKVSYDYWVFKTAGYLPWPASKMPKLPCDWVFE